METSLDDLFSEAIAAARAATPAPAAAPSSWYRSRGIALIHADTQALLGNFTEYLHRGQPGSRRLVREDPPMPVEATETLCGSWWTGQDVAPTPKRAWHESRLTTLPLEFRTLGVSSPSAAVYAVFGEGHLDRVELAADTLLARPGSSLTELVILPAKTDILRDLSRATITLLLTQLGQPL